MVKRKSRTPKGRAPKNLRRERVSFAEVLSAANRRAHEQANRKSGGRQRKSMKAAIASAVPDYDDFEPVEWTKRFIRWAIALALLPLCWVTTWTFLSQFSHATLHREFWQTAEFWYFAIGVLVMIGWFWSGLFQSFFLYLYVLGHELTHAAFVVIYRGKVTDFHVSTSGGYITTNKTNLMIALSPYFVPLWSIVAVIFYVLFRQWVEPSKEWDRGLYAVVGLTWTFHLVWTLWMIPRDQPDLKENGTFLSLVVIYFGNLIVLVALLCLAVDAPWQSFRDFGMEWLKHAVTWGDMLWRWGNEVFVRSRVEFKL